MKHLVFGILAHVDAGKTTLSEGLLYRTGRLKQMGRVDHQTAFLDTDTLERERGITIFSKQARFPLGDVSVTLLDTPGHVDFSSEMERTLSVLDYALLIVSGSDGIQGHTQTLWRLLKRYNVPTVLFVNKMDLPDTDKSALLAELKSRLDDGCVDFDPQTDPDQLAEHIALCDESILTRYLDSGTVEDSDICALIQTRKLFPCLFGSALKLDGVDGLLNLLKRYALPKKYRDDFGATVYKISRDEQGNRLTHMKLTGGYLRVKSLITGTADETEWNEKIEQIRLYSGAKFQISEEITAGGICAVTGLTHTYAGQGLGREAGSEPPILSPVLAYQVILPPDCDPHRALQIFYQLEEEDPQLHILWDKQLGEITLQLMGQIHLEVLSRMILDRFGLVVAFGVGNIVYRETISEPVIGIGHFEPLRHYAEVHLMLEPLPQGRGLEFDTQCSGDVLDFNWQRLAISHLGERIHRGVLTGSPITDMKLTVIAGKAHLKHTGGGDFRQATYRAVRQGLMSAQSLLLEPYYDFRLEVPTEQIGRAMTDVQRMGGQMDVPNTMGDMGILTGSAPVSSMGNYSGEVIAYTRGLGRLSTSAGGYAPCHNQDEVMAKRRYCPERDLLQTPDSVFCEGGTGFIVPWYEVPDYAHVVSDFPTETAKIVEELIPVHRSRPSQNTGGLAQDKELQVIFERTYGKAKPRDFRPQESLKPKTELEFRHINIQEKGPEYLLVDGYNIIFAWDDLKVVARDNLDAARQKLMDLMSNYQGFLQCELILVFDAYKVPRGVGEISKYHNIHVVYTKEAETADAYIEKTTYRLAKVHRVRVATSDGVEQLIILGHGALRVSATAFRAEVAQVTGQIASMLNTQNRNHKSFALRDALARAKKGVHHE